MRKSCGTWLNKLIGDEEVKRLYLEEDMSIKEIANKYGVDHSGVLKYLHRLKIPLKPIKHKYHTDNECFSNPNLANSYWAGVIAADGCISERDHAVILVCKSTDISLLEELKKFTKCEVPILRQERISNGNHQWYDRLVIYSQDIVDDLSKNWNITPRKTLTLEAPPVTNNNALAYIIGYIDGDGCIRYHLDKRYNEKYLSIEIAGTFNVLNWISEIIEPIIGQKSTVKKVKDKNCYILKITGKYAELLKARLIQIPLDFRLSRKWNISK